MTLLSTFFNSGCSAPVLLSNSAVAGIIDNDESSVKAGEASIILSSFSDLPSVLTAYIIIKKIVIIRDNFYFKYSRNKMNLI